MAPEYQGEVVIVTGRWAGDPPFPSSVPALKMAEGQDKGPVRVGRAVTKASPGADMWFPGRRAMSGACAAVSDH